LTAREKVILVPLVVLIFWIGIYPKPFFDRIEPAVKQILERVDYERRVGVDSHRVIGAPIQEATTPVVSTIVVPNDGAEQ
jgi:hypothetical protein